MRPDRFTAQVGRGEPCSMRDLGLNLDSKGFSMHT
jgi:hypothetical protein